ncbi:PspC domain-containing protein [Puerhibacterium puerhi]|uniref:PspC domain-containing protein n=1 Tax=Puerhibacterium puerhi TaxID=2692623 RepID=UPI00135AA9FB|nr:PspC domain-containing protein [Puerhibacterium puerhi]
MSTEPFPPHPGPGTTGPAGAGPSSTPPGPGPTPPAGGDRFFDSIRRTGLYRSEDRWVGGVASGVADRLGWDPLLVRGLLFLSFFLSGAGLVLYGIGWALLPEQRDGRIHLQRALHGDFDVAILGAAATAVVGFAWNGGFGGWWDGGWDWLVALVWIAVWGTVIWLVVRYAVQRRDERQAWAQGWQGPTPDAGAPAGAPAGGPAAFAVPAPGATTSAPPPGAPAGAPHGPDVQADAARLKAETRARAAQDRARAAQDKAQARAWAAQERAQARAARPVVRGPGGSTVAAVLGVALLLGALLLAQEQGLLDLPWTWDANVGLVWLGAALAVVGLGIVVAGMRGRSSGVLGFLAIVGLVVAVPFGSMLADRDPWPVLSLDGSGRELRGDAVVVPSGVDEAEAGYSLRFGDPTIDLTRLDLSGASADEPVEVPIDLAAGAATVIVPDGVPVVADVEVAAGSVVWDVDTDGAQQAGFGSTTFVNDQARTAEPVLVLDVEVAAGEIRIQEENR